MHPLHSFGYLLPHLSGTTKYLSYIKFKLQLNFPPTFLFILIIKKRPLFYNQNNHKRLKLKRISIFMNELANKVLKINIKLLKNKK